MDVRVLSSGRAHRRASAPKRLRNIAPSGGRSAALRPYGAPAPTHARSSPPVPSVLRRYGLLVPALAGSVLLVVAEFSALYEIRIITVTAETVRGGSHHGYALLVIALASLLMAFGAVVGRSRPAAAALLVLALAAAVVTLAIDLPDLDETGPYGRDYERAVASAGPGFYLETLGTALLLVSAVAIALFGPRPERAPGERGRARDADAAASPPA